MEQLVNFVIRPPRAEYDPEHDLLRPRFSLKGREFQREDLKITNNQGHVLQCSHYMPFPISEERPLPCVIYCHGNSGCRADASEAVVILLPSNITVFTLDFSGSGLSEGDYVTLGWNEMDDLKVVVRHLRTDKRISCIGLWGRSMGAVTSLMYGAQDPSIAGMVLDSPFSNLVDLMMELVDLYKFRLPKFTLKVAIQYMRKVIQKKARFDIMELDAVKVAKRSYIPALFGHATEDSFIQPHHSDLIYEAYLGDKNIIKFSGDHNSQRSQFYYDSINIFFHNVLQPPEAPETPADRNGLGFAEGIDENVWLQVLMAMQPPHTLSDEEGGYSDVEPHWHMSRTEVPQNLDSLKEDISRLMIKEETSKQRACSSSGQEPPQVLEKEQSDDLMLAAPCNGMDRTESWMHYSPETAQSRSTEAMSQNRFAHFPSTPEDEERMIMEAIAASLQDCSAPELNDTHDANSSEAIAASLQDCSAPEHNNTHVPLNLAVEQHPVTQEPSAGTPTNSDNQLSVEHRQAEGVQSSAAPDTQTIGVLEALGQKWGIGLFRAMSSSKQAGSR